MSRNTGDSENGESGEKSPWGKIEMRFSGLVQISRVILSYYIFFGGGGGAEELRERGACWKCPS